MSHIKLILPGTQDFGENPAQLINVAGRGLRGNDLGSFIKRAGHKMADAFNKLALAPGETPIHLIALGATEFYGPNRNGDGFTEACCRKYHDTFVKHARWYRNHQNKDPKKSYGIVKYSDYNEKMHRLELIVALNATKEAAKRNGGLVADRELEKLARGESLAVSMSCKVAYDVCSGCGNRARTRADYCTEETCPYGGAMNNLCKVAEDGHILHVDNPHPLWFDISDVFRPADRIAYVFGQLQKSAGARTISSAELAEEIGITAPLELSLLNVGDTTIREQIKLAYALADLEKNMLNTRMVKCASVPNTRTGPVDFPCIITADMRGALLKAMANEKIALALPDFIQFAAGCTRDTADSIAEKIRPNMYGLFSKMCDDVDKLAEDLSTSPFRPTVGEPTAGHKEWAKKQANNASLNPYYVRRRAWAHTLRNEPIVLDVNLTNLTKTAAHDGLARAYGLYKLAFLHEVQSKDDDFMLTSDLVVRQNYIS